MTFVKIDIDKLIDSKIIFQKKHFRYKLDNLTREYQELYHNTKFVNETLGFENKEIIIPLTRNKKTNEYSFYGDPIEIFSDKIISLENYEKIKNQIDKLKGSKLFKFEIKDDKKIIDSKFSLVEKVINEIYIDLSQSAESIKSNFSSNLRNEINKNYDNTIYEVVDKNNYKAEEIFEMMKFHIKISRRQTRSNESWKINERMLLDDLGFLTRIKFNNKIVSYSFFFHDKFTCNYLSSVGEREYYKKIRNMHHKSLWMAINHAKKNNCNYFFIGPITLYSKNEITEKEKNIERFKSKFKGINSKFVILSDLPDYNFYKNLLCIK
jgi:hypothetical protein